MSNDRKDSLDQRLDKLEADLAKQRKADAKPDGAATETARGYRQAVKISSEFISAVIVGALLGYLVDWLAGSSPWGMVFFLLLGFVAGVMNVLRTVGVVTSPHPVDKLGEMNRTKTDGKPK